MSILHRRHHDSAPRVTVSKLKLIIEFVKVGFSLAGNGVLDAWAYRNSEGQIVKI